MDAELGTADLTTCRHGQGETLQGAGISARFLADERAAAELLRRLLRKTVDVILLALTAASIFLCRVFPSSRNMEALII